MAPPTRVFSASDLPERIQFDAENKRRKPAASGDGSSGTGKIDLSACELLEMMQWSCRVEGDGPSNRPVVCAPVPRYFRRCKYAKGTFMVETTSWEGTTATTAKRNPANESESPGADANQQTKSGVVAWTSSDKAPW